MEEMLHVYKVEMTGGETQVLVVTPTAYILNLMSDPSVSDAGVLHLEIDFPVIQYEWGLQLWRCEEGRNKRRPFVLGKNGRSYDIVEPAADVSLGQWVIGHRDGELYTDVGSVADKGKIPRTTYEELQAGVAQEQIVKAQAAKLVYDAARVDLEGIERRYNPQIAVLQRRIKDLEEGKAGEIKNRWIEAGQEVERTLGRGTSLDDLVARRVWR